jgi:hypothetical protein
MHRFHICIKLGGDYDRFDICARMSDDDIGNWAGSTGIWVGVVLHPPIWRTNMRASRFAIKHEK